MIYLKICGSICLLIACIGYSQILNHEFTWYIRSLEQLYDILSMIQGEIYYTHEPLNEVLEDISSRTEEPFKRWLQEMAGQTAKKEKTEWSHIWKDGAKQNLNELHLKSAHRNLLQDYGMHLQNLSRDSDSSALTYDLKRLTRAIESEKENIKTKKKLCNYLGIMTGLFLVILLF